MTTHGLNSFQIILPTCRLPTPLLVKVNMMISHFVGKCGGGLSCKLLKVMDEVRLIEVVVSIRKVRQV
jgi:hypothetical protein